MRLLAVIGAAAGASATLAQAAGAGNTSAGSVSAPLPHTQPRVDIAERLLAMQNAERARLGLAPLVWSERLADDATRYGKILLSRGELEHSDEKARKGTGENLWMGTSGAWDVEAMMGMFLEERRYFRSATFPNISLTGNWSDVGHYSQIVWKDTKEVGCGLQTGGGKDVLVCRYSPAGNVVGKAPY